MSNERDYSRGEYNNIMFEQVFENLYLPELGSVMGNLNKT